MPFDDSDSGLCTNRKFKAFRKGLRLVGLVASFDPDSDGVPMSVIAARRAGVRVVMIACDYLETAVAIAHNVHILQPQDNEQGSVVDCVRSRPDGRTCRAGRWTCSIEDAGLRTCQVRGVLEIGK